MKIEKDAEWNRLEGRVGQLQGTLSEAKCALNEHMERVVLEQLGLTLDESVVLDRMGVRFLVSRIDARDSNPWVYGRKFKKDGTPSAVEQCLYTDWQKVG